MLGHAVKLRRLSGRHFRFLPESSDRRVQWPDPKWLMRQRERGVRRVSLRMPPSDSQVCTHRAPLHGTKPSVNWAPERGSHATSLVCATANRRACYSSKFGLGGAIAASQFNACAYCAFTDDALGFAISTTCTSVLSWSVSANDHAVRSSVCASEPSPDCRKPNRFAKLLAK